MFSNRSEQITQGQFHRSFRNLIVLTWVLPAIVGLSFILAIGVLSLEQMVGILLTPFEPLYIIGWLVFSVWYFTRYVRPIEAYIAQPVKTSESIQILLVTIRGFPLRYWSFFLLYLVVAPATVIWSAEWFTDYVARPVDWFRIELIALIVSIIVGLPIFFLIFDLFGRVLGNIPLTRPFITVKTKVFLIGALVPLLIDTILVQYYWTRTGLFTFETFLVWLSLEILAIGASLIFVRSFAQSLFPLEELFSGESDYHLASTSKLVPASTDEIGVLTVNYRHLIDDLNLAREVLELRNHLLRQYGNLESIGQVAEAVVNISQETLEADEVLLLLRDKTASRLLCVARSGHSYCGEGFFDLALREGSVIEAVMQSQQTRVIADLAVEAVAGKDLASHLQAESMIIGPLAVEGISIGVLILANQRHSPDYMEREISLLEGITVEAALMLRNLQLRGLHDSAVAEKTEREARIALLMDFTEEGIFGADKDGICTFINRSALDMLGYDDEQELLGQSIHEMIHHSYADGSHYPKEECTVRKSALANESGHSVDEVHWRRDGSSFPVEYWSHPIYREGEVVGTVVTFVDITERLQVQQELKLHRHSLEKQVRQRTRELAATNRELEAFSYSVSHDLRAPLRAIDGFSQALLEDYHDRLDDTGRDYLRRVRKGSKRMGLLIDEILQLSRVTRTSFVRKEVDLSRLANDVIDRLRSHEPERRVKVEIDQGLICHGDESLLEILLENLLNNAWKYSANEACPLIKFSSYRDSDRVVYYIEDNGAGFDMNYSQGLFKAFQRMHSEAEFPGTGIGLASVQRIVNRHGGKVWAQAEEDRGATFYFTVEEN